jgi:hypothetical protein
MAKSNCATNLGSDRTSVFAFGTVTLQGLQTPNRHHVSQNLILSPTTTCLGVVCKCNVTDL